MKNKNISRIVVKIGSRVLTNEAGLLNKRVVKKLVEDISTLNNERNIEVIIVSSGAVSMGRSVLDISKEMINLNGIDSDKEIVVEQILASVGQVKLVTEYENFFDKHNLQCAQILTTRRDFADRSAYLNLKLVVENLLKLNIIPIFNENDVLSQEELDFTDNDQLSYMIAAMLQVDALFILTDIDGVFNKNPTDPTAKVVHKIENISKYFSAVDDSISKGKGGMYSKLLSADIITSLGIPMYIANGMKKNIISRILLGQKLGTYFPAKKSKKTALKKWLATAANEKGTIVVSTFLADMLRSEKTTSVLFPGIENIDGDFDKGDVILIVDEKNNSLAKGIVKYPYNKLQEKIDQYNNMTDTEKSKVKSSEIIAVHYDYLVFI